METMERLYTVEELSEYLKLLPIVIRRKLVSGEIKGFKIGKEWRIKESALQEFIENGND